MDEYISKKAVLKAVEEDFNKDWGERGANGDWDYIDGARDEYDDVINIICQMPTTDVQPVDTKEILRHLDSLMICVGNAYDTSHGLLQSDMEFIEKQEKIIKELLSNKE